MNLYTKSKSLCKDIINYAIHISNLYKGNKNYYFETIYITEIFAHLNNSYTDNIDLERFSESISKNERNTNRIHDTKYSSYIFQYYLNHTKELEQVYHCLEDTESKRWFLELLCYKVLGPSFVKLPTNNEYHWSVRNLHKDMPSMPSSLDAKCSSEQIKFFEFSFNNKIIKFDGFVSGIIWSFFLGQYFFERGKIRIMPEKDDIVIDAGACFGDTALSFSNAVGEGGLIFSFDFLPVHLEIMKKNFNNNDWAKNIKLCPYVLSDKTSIKDNINKDLNRTVNPGSSFVYGGLSENAYSSIRIDDFLVKEGIAKVDFIKMDIEGYEKKALIGASQSIKKFKPKLAISIYHKLEDFYEIPLYIKSLRSDYKFYIDHYTIHGEETILYAI